MRPSSATTLIQTQHSTHSTKMKTAGDISSTRRLQVQENSAKQLWAQILRKYKLKESHRKTKKV
jgi:hypothetical protein